MDITMHDYFFDPDEDVCEKFSRSLPHWNQEDKIQFVTFRLNDSLPREIIENMVVEKDIFIKNNPEPWSEDVRRRYNRKIGARLSRVMDAGYGECLLRLPEVRKILVDALHHYDNDKYHILAYVIMPNHVHLLLVVKAGESLDMIIGSVKSYSARGINKLLQRTGSLWQKEYYDTIVRSVDHLGHYLKYIRSNPRNLPASSYTLYLRPYKVKE